MIKSKRVLPGALAFAHGQAESMIRANPAKAEAAGKFDRAMAVDHHYRVSGLAQRLSGS